MKHMETKFSAEETDQKTNSFKGHKQTNDTKWPKILIISNEEDNTYTISEEASSWITEKSFQNAVNYI